MGTTSKRGLRNVLVLIVLGAVLGTQHSAALPNFQLFSNHFPVGQEVILLAWTQSGDVQFSVERMLEPQRALTQIYDDNPTPGKTQLVKRFTFKAGNSSSDVRYVSFGQLAEGVYFVRAKQGQATASAFAFVTRLSVLVKAGIHGTTIWTADAITGKPRDADIHCWKYKESTPKILSSRNTDGLVYLPPNMQCDYVVGNSGASWSFADFSEQELEQHNWSSYTLVYTDRPAYRPGERVYIKGLALDANTGSPLADERMRVVVIPAGSNRNNIRSEQLIQVNTNPFGSFTLEYVIPNDASTGQYLIRVSPNGQLYSEVASHGRFWVEPPGGAAYTVSLEASTDRAVKGETVRYRLQAADWTGKPPVGAHARYTITRRLSHWLISPYLMSAPFERVQTQADWYQAGSVEQTWEARNDSPFTAITSGENRIDASGGFNFDLPLEREDNGQAFEYEVRAEVFDTQGQRATVARRLAVLPANLKVDIDYTSKPKRLGESARFRISTRDLSGTPVSALLQLRIVWSSQTGNTFRSEIVQTLDVRTNASGLTDASFAVREFGMYYIELNTNDTANRPLVTKYEWGWWWLGFSDNELNDLDFLIPVEEKLPLSVTSTDFSDDSELKISVKNPFPGTPILFTLEANGVRRLQVVRSDAPTVTITDRVGPEFSPSLYVTATMFQNGQTYLARERVSIQRRGSRLNVRIAAPRTARTGETVQITLSTANLRNGFEVPAEVSVAVVDEALFATRPDIVPEMRDFFYRPRWPDVLTTYSGRFDFYPPLIERIFWPGYGQLVIPDDPTRPIHGFFGTVLWVPGIVTDENGQAVVSLKLPDVPGRWRITVRASTRRGLVGEARTQIISTQP